MKFEVSSKIGDDKGQKYEEVVKDNIDEIKKKIFQEAEEIPIKTEDRDADGNLLAYPDGPKSNLIENQWKIVRTQSFKEWFGDWQNDRERASRVVDQNGEPLLVMHRSLQESIKPERRKDFSVFSRFIHFTSKWVGDAENSWYGNNVHYAFLNIRKMEDCGPGGTCLYQTMPKPGIIKQEFGFIGNIDDKFLKFLEEKEYDGLYSSGAKRENQSGPLMYTDEYVVLHPESQVLFTKIEKD